MELIVTDLAVDCRLILGSNAELECVYTRAQLGSSSRQQTQSRMTAVLISAISHQNREGGQGEKKTKNFAVIPTLSQDLLSAQRCSFVCKQGCHAQYH